MFKSQKRFIAGAICPACGAQDAVRVFAADGDDYRDCVRCGFIENLKSLAGAANSGVEADADGAAARARETDVAQPENVSVQILKVIPPTQR